MVQGLNADALRAQMDEVHILEDGSLDLPGAVLADLDLCLGALHTALDLDTDTQTERVLCALPSPTFMGWPPTGRRINERPPIEIDLGCGMEAAADRGRVLDLNAQPERIVLSDVCCKRAKAPGFPSSSGRRARCRGSRRSALRRGPRPARLAGGRRCAQYEAVGRGCGSV